MSEYQFVRRMKSGKRATILVRHARIGEQRWHSGRVRADVLCAHCKALIPAETICYLPDTTMGNRRDRLCLPCVRKWENPLADWNSQPGTVSLAEFKASQKLSEQEWRDLCEFSDAIDDGEFR